MRGVCNAIAYVLVYSISFIWGEIWNGLTANRIDGSLCTRMWWWRRRSSASKLCIARVGLLIVVPSKLMKCRLLRVIGRAGIVCCMSMTNNLWIKLCMGWLI